MYATGNSSQVAVFVSTTVSSTGFMASVTVAPVGGVVGLLNILLDQDELDVDIRCLGCASRDDPARLLIVQSGNPAADGYGLN
jgi:hypothetical protein